MRVLLILFFFGFQQVSAQLFVKDNHYIFVKDQVLFVENNINLQNTDSKIYLRREAQLLQGSGTTGNSGIGQLSIYQNGTTHNYAYNYWCAPVGNQTATAGNENFRANLFDEATGLTTSTDVAFTAYDGTSSPLTIADYWIYTFENSSQYSQWFQRGSTGNISPGLGFTMKGTSGSGNNQQYDFRGKPNNGTIANTVAADVWTLIGNPYPSALDTVDFIHDTDNMAAITGTLYFWEQDLSVLSHNIADYVGGYATYTINAAGTVETFIPATFDTYNSDGSLNTTGTSSTSGKQVGRYIAVGQGFMVEGRSGTTGIVQTKNTHREFYKQSGPDSHFFRTQNSEAVRNSTNYDDFFKEIPQAYKRFRLNIDFNDVYTRQLVQTFHDTEATEGFDYGLESKSPTDVGNDAYWSINNEPYTAQALPFNENLSIPLHIKLNTNGTIRIRISDIQHFDTSQPIYLHDIENDTYTNLRLLPFNIQLTQGSYTDRFEIKFSNNILSREEITTSEFTIIQNNTQQTLTILNPELMPLQTIRLYDILGKLIFEHTNIEAQPSYTISTSMWSEAMYVVKIQSDTNKVFSKKILVKK